LEQAELVEAGPELELGWLELLAAAEQELALLLHLALKKHELSELELHQVLTEQGSLALELSLVPTELV
jgi:hypothetical protein